MRLEIRVMNPDIKVFKSLKEIPPSESHKHKFGKGAKIGSKTIYRTVKKGEGMLGISPLKRAAKKYSCKTCEKEVYYCPGCKGYIEGEPSEEPYDTRKGSSPGSKGTDSYCVRCGDHIARSETLRSIP